MSRRVGPGTIPVQASKTFATDMVWNTASYAAIGTGTELNATFVAPKGGIVVIYWGAGALETSTSTAGFLSYEIRNDNVSGSVVVAASDDRAASRQSASGVGASMVDVVTGLTAGNTYFIRLMGKATGSTTLTASGARLTIVGV